MACRGMNIFECNSLLSKCYSRYRRQLSIIVEYKRVYFHNYCVNASVFYKREFPQKFLPVNNSFLNYAVYEGYKNFISSDVRYRLMQKADTTVLKESSPEDDEDKEKRLKAWKRMKLSLIFMGSFFTIFGIYSFYILGSPDRDEDNKVIEDEFSSLPLISQLCRRFLFKLKYYTKVIQEPSQQKLLPDPLEYPYIQPPYTLVLELTDLLVHPDWTYKTGWRFKKRPNVDQFLEQVSPPLFEVVVFTAEQGITVFPILNQLDKNGVIVYRLVRDSTDFIDGHHVKNLEWLNRDLSKVIVVDWNPESVKLHPNNAFIIPKWTGTDDDRTLIDLAVFLRTIAFNKIEDVREVLEYYRQFADPMEAFRENQRKLAEQLEEQEKIEQSKKQHPPLTSRFSKSFTF